MRKQFRRLAGWSLMATALTLTGGTSDERFGAVSAHADDATHVETGIVSYYHSSLHGNLTANGETYDENAMTAAHPSLPFGTRVRVTKLSNGESVDVRINDRGPFVEGRIVDLSKAAAQELGIMEKGIANVRLEVL